MASLYGLRNAMNKSPIQITTTVISVVNLGIIMDWYALTGDQVAGLNTALLAVLALFIASKTSNDQVLREMSEATVVETGVRIDDLGVEHPVGHP